MPPHTHPSSESRAIVFAILEDRAGNEQNMSLHDMKSLISLRASDKEHNAAMKSSMNVAIQNKLAQMQRLGWLYDNVRIITKKLQGHATRSTTQSRHIPQDFDLILLTI